MIFLVCSQTMRTDREREQADYEARLGKLEEDHSSEMQEVEETNSKKLMTEYEKYQELQARSLKLQEVISSLHHRIVDSIITRYRLFVHMYNVDILCVRPQCYCVCVC